MPRLARPELTLMPIECELGVEVVTPRKECAKNQEVTTVSRETEHTQDSVSNRLEQTITDLNLDDEYDSDYERSAGSRESPDLHAQLDT